MHHPQLHPGTSLINYPVGGLPFAMVANRTGTRVYVTTNTVSVIDTSNNTVIAVIPIGTNPNAIAINPDGSFVYVTNHQDNTVSVIDTSTNAVVATVPVVYRPTGIAVNPAGTFVYVSSGAADAVSIIDTSTNTVTATLSGVGGPDITVNPAGTFAYATNGGDYSNTVSVINTATNAVTANVTVGTFPYHVEVHPAGTFAYVANYNSRSVSVIDTATNTVSATVLVGSNPYFVTVNSAGTRVYVSDGSIIDTSSNTVIGTLVGSTGQIALVNPPTSVAYGSGPVTLTAASGSGLPVIFTSTTTSICTVNGTTMTLVRTGYCSITASQAGNGNYTAATPVTQSFNITQRTQTITFGQPAAIAFGSGPVTLSATANSGLTVSFASTTTPVCTVSGTTVTLVSAGTCSITGSQAGNGNDAAATPVTQSFSVTQGAQILTFTQPTAVAFGSGSVTLSATASSGLTVSFASTTTPICTVSGSTVTLVSVGTCSITASQAGNGSYAAATPVTQSFNVTQAAQTITFGATGNVTTVAGNGSASYSGDGGAATSAGVQTPLGIAVDSAGNLYVADDFSFAVRKISKSNGTISTLAGNLSYITDVAADPAGNILVAAYDSSVVKKIDGVTGAVSTIVGAGGFGLSGDGGPVSAAAFCNPSGIALSATGKIYISDFTNNRVRVADKNNNTVTTIAGGGGACSGSRGFSGDNGPASSASISLTSYYLSTDAANNVYFADGGSRIRKISAGTGIISTVAGNGSAGYAGDGGLATNAQLNNPQKLVTDSVGNMYITDAGNQRIRRIDAATGIISTVAGNGVAAFAGDGGDPLNASFNNPNSLVLDPVTPGVLYVTDFSNHRIRRITVGGSVPSSVFYGSGPLTLNAVATSALPVTFASTTPAVCTISGTTVTLVSVGTCSITASQAGNGSYAAATPVTQSFNVTQPSQTLTFTQPTAVAFGSGSVTLSATAGSGLTVSFASTTTPICTVSGSTVTLVSVGSCSITATQTGNGSYAAATPVTQSFTVLGTAQILTFTQPTAVAFGSGSVTLSATANSGLTVSFASTTTPVCTVSGTTVTLVSAGTCSITASQSGNANYAAATPVTQSFTIVGTAQIITFGSLSNVSLGVGSASLTATASSELPVSLASTTSSVCTVNGSTVTLVSAGSCSITASQAGNGTYAAATPVTQSFTVNPTSQILTFNSLPGVIYGVSPFNLTATASSGLVATFASTSPIVCTVSGNTVTVVAPGTCSITASQSGNGNYLAAANVVQSFTISSPANSVSLLVGDGSGSAGQIVEVGIQLTSSGTANPGGFQLDLSYDATKLAYVSARTGAQATAADKSISVQTQQNGDVRLLGVGFNQNVIANGIVAYATFRLNAQFTSGSTLVTPKNCTATDPIGFGLVSPCTAGTIRPNTCDINVSGGVNVADVQLIINEALGIIPATHDLNRDSRVNVADVQLVINAALGLGCNLP